MNIKILKGITLTISRKLYFVVIAAILIPFAILIFAAFTRITGLHIQNQDTELETIRDSLSRTGENYFNDFSRYAYLNFTEDGMNPESFYEHLNYKGNYIQQISLYDDDYSFTGGMSDNGRLEESEIQGEIRSSLQNEIFSDYFSYRFILDGGDFIPVLFLINNVLDGESPYRYAAIIMKMPFYSAYLLEFENIRIQLLNRNYHVLYDSKFPENPYITLLNQITEKMIDGYSNTETFESMRISYTSIRIFPERIYFSVIQDQSLAFVQRSGFLNLMILAFLLVSAGAFVTAWYLNKSVAEFGENLLVSDRYTGDMLFFRRLLKSIERVRKNLPVLDEIRNDINYLYNDLEVIQEKSPQGKKDSGRLSRKKSAVKKTVRRKPRVKNDKTAK